MSIERLRFRGKATIAAPGEWMYSPKDVRLDEFWKMVLLDAIDPATVSQWTGLVDSKGVEIWEGDVVQCGKYAGYIFWDDSDIDYSLPLVHREIDDEWLHQSVHGKAARWSLRGSNSEWKNDEWSTRNTYSLEDLDVDIMVVIGSIHDKAGV